MKRKNQDNTHESKGTRPTRKVAKGALAQARGGYGYPIKIQTKIIK